MNATTATLPPLESLPPNGVVAATAPESPPPVPHRAWYYLHSDAILEELVAIRSLAAELDAADNPDVLRLLCIRGVELDRDTYRAAYEAPDVHPDWVRIVDLTRWMIANCHGDAVRSVADVLPKLDAVLARVEAWIAGLTQS